MQALVTGAAGFIGSHLTELLLERGHRVRALVHYNSRDSWDWLEPFKADRPDELEIVRGDITDGPQMRLLVRECTHVFHLAALIGIPYSYRAPQSYVRTNVMGTANLLAAALDQGVTRFVHTSTSEVYGTARYTPIDEGHPLQAQSPYSASKIGADKLVESFGRSFDLPTVIVRPFNTFGPRQSARAVIPTIILQALAGSEVRLGSLDPVRDLTLVQDTAAGIAAAGAAEAAIGEVIHLGTGQAVSIGVLAGRILELIGGDKEIVADPARVRPDTSEVLELVSDNSKAERLLGWRPEHSLDDGLKITIEWFRRHPARSEEYVV